MNELSLLWVDYYTHLVLIGVPRVFHPYVSSPSPPPPVFALSAFVSARARRRGAVRVGDRGEGADPERLVRAVDAGGTGSGGMEYRGRGHARDRRRRGGGDARAGLATRSGVVARHPGGERGLRGATGGMGVVRRVCGRPAQPGRVVQRVDLGEKPRRRRARAEDAPARGGLGADAVDAFQGAARPAGGRDDGARGDPVQQDPRRIPGGRAGPGPCRRVDSPGRR